MTNARLNFQVTDELIKEIEAVGSLQPWFDEIFFAAKDENKTRLRQALQHVTVNAINSAEETPIFLLAYKGEKKAVQFLLRENAAERLMLSFNAAVGYTTGVHPAEAIKLYDEAATPALKRAIVKGMVGGYIDKGNITEANNLLAEHPTERYVLLTIMVEKLACLSLIDEAKQLIRKNPDREFCLMQRLVRGVAVAGKTTLVNQIISQRPAVEFPRLLSQAIKGYALSGNSVALNHMLTMAESTFHRKRLMGTMMSLYSFLNRQQQMHELFAIAGPDLKEPLFEAMIYGHVLSGHIDKINLFLQACSNHGSLGNILAMGAYAGQVTFVNQLLNSQTDPDKKEVFVQAMIQTYAMNGDVDNVNQLMKSHALLNDKSEYERLTNAIKGYGLDYYIAAIEELFTVNVRHRDLLLHRVVRAYSAVGLMRELDDFIKNNPFPAELFKVQGFIEGGYIDAAKAVFASSTSKPFLLQQMASAYPEFDYWREASLLEGLEKHAEMIDKIVEKLFQKKELATEAAALQILPLFEPTLQSALIDGYDIRSRVEELAEHSEVEEKVDRRQWLTQGAILYKLINTPPINTQPVYSRIREGMAWLKREVREWLLVSGVLLKLAREKQITKDFTIAVLRYLSPLTQAEATYLYTDLSKGLMAATRHNLFYKTRTKPSDVALEKPALRFERS